MCIEDETDLLEHVLRLFVADEIGQHPSGGPFVGQLLAGRSLQIVQSDDQQVLEWQKYDMMSTNSIRYLFVNKVVSLFVYFIRYS